MNPSMTIFHESLTEALVWAHLGETYHLGDWAGRTAHGLIGDAMERGLGRDAATFLLARLLHLAGESGLRLPATQLVDSIQDLEKSRDDQRGEGDEEISYLDSADRGMAEARARAALEYLGTWTDAKKRHEGLGSLLHVVVDVNASLPDTCLVIEWDGHLYLHRTWCAERAFLETLAPFAPGPTVNLLTKEALALSKDLAAAGFHLHPMQEKAAALAGASRLVLLTGGPGTGKTTTVVQVLRLLLEKDPETRIALGAPTGRAAVRLAEAVRGELKDFPWKGHEGVDGKLASLTGATLHALIGMNPLGAPRHDASNPIPFDFVVADEATMADLGLLTALLRALPPKARLMLVGDPAQLPSVDTGSVFADLLPQPKTGGVFKDVTVALTENKRSKACRILSGLARRMADPDGTLMPLGDSDGDKNIREGIDLLDKSNLLPKATGVSQVPIALESARVQKRVADFLWVDADFGRLNPIWNAWYPWETLAAAAAGVEPKTASEGEKQISETHQEHVILVPGHQGPWGTVALNQAMRQRLISHLRVHHTDVSLDPVGFIPGEPILMPSSRRDLDLQNGDRGVVVNRAGKLVALFPSTHGEANGDPFREVDLDQIPEARPAWALTIHKSQGSQFKRVALLIPSSAVRLISRELAYTGITRAKDCCLLVCTAETWVKARDRVVVRDSGIKDWAASGKPKGLGRSS